MPLYEHDSYLDKDIPYLISTEIVEYDISSAGFNLCRYYKLLPESKLQYLESLEKKERQRALGLLCRDDDTLNENLKKAFVNIRKEFFEANGIKDSDVLSIKKDAIFMLRRCHVTEFGNVVFKEKHVYTSYYYLNRKEFYVGERLDVKGISDAILSKHDNYMLDFLYKFFKLIETSSRRNCIRELMGFVDAYKAGNLEIGYYRELNEHSLYRMKESVAGWVVMADTVESIDGVDTGYNYIRYIVPLIQVLI